MENRMVGGWADDQARLGCLILNEKIGHWLGSKMMRDWEEDQTRFGRKVVAFPHDHTGDDFEQAQGDGPWFLCGTTLSVRRVVCLPPSTFTYFGRL